MIRDKLMEAVRECREGEARRKTSPHIAATNYLRVAQLAREVEKDAERVLAAIEAADDDTGVHDAPEAA